MTQSRTLPQLLEHRAARLSGPFFEYLGPPAAGHSLEELFTGATRWAGRLRRLGVCPGDRVGLVMPSRPEVLEALFGVLMCRAAVVPLPAPSQMIAPARHKERFQLALKLTQPRAMVIPRQAMRFAAQLLEELQIEAVALEERGEHCADPDPGLPDDLAVVQMTSGSTGRPRGVALTHGNILANVRNIVQHLELGPGDRCVSWLPLHHDMGLVGMVLSMIGASTPTLLMPPESFVLHPVSWLEALSRFGGTISTAPNFGYQLCVDRVPDDAIERLNLSRWRSALNGAEPVRPETLRAFSRRFGPCGFREQAFLPVYGMAEAALAVAFPPLDRGPLLDCVDPGMLRSSGRARPAKKGRRYVSVGRAFPDSAIRIFDPESKAVLGERREGEILIRGPSVMTGYFHDDEESRVAMHQGWLRTGDLGYVAGEELFVTGRRKALMIRAGEKFHAEEIEASAEKVSGVRRGCSAAFAVDGPGGEEITVVVERSARAAASAADLARAVTDRVERGVGLRPDRVHVVHPHTVPKTTSGKVERARCRDLMLQGVAGCSSEN